MDTQNMITLPPKYLKPIYMNVTSTDVTTTSTANYSADYTATATQDYQFQTTTSTDYQATTDYNTTTDYQAPTTDYQMGTTDFATTTSATDFTASTEQPTFTETESTLNTGAMTGGPAFKLIRRGSGITANEQNGIVSTAMSIIQNGLTPISNKTAQGIKKKLGGDWLVIVYPEGKSIDFNMTCVQGNDYLYFIIGENAFQVCRLR